MHDCVSRIFNRARIPRVGGPDVLSDPPQENPSAWKVLVMARGHCFAVKICDDDVGSPRLIPVNELERRLHEIVDHVVSKTPLSSDHPCIGFLSSGQRDFWGEV
jgi:hypothetical protein